MTQPAPYDWHDAKQFTPPVNETVRVHQLFWWAFFDGTKWMAVDDCGNRCRLEWTPEYWRREYRPTEPKYSPLSVACSFIRYV